VGSEGGPCFSNGTCNKGLECLSKVCVRLPDAGQHDAADVPDLAVPDKAGPDQLVPDIAVPDLPMPDLPAPDMMAADLPLSSCSDSLHTERDQKTEKSMMHSKKCKMRQR